MPKRSRPSYAARSRAFKRFRRNASRKRGVMLRRPGRARPMRSLRLSYRAPNKYLFCRETVPATIKPTLIGPAATEQNIGYLNFENLKMEQLADFVSDFGSLFANYKVSKIQTILTPMWSNTVMDVTTNTSDNAGFSDLLVTRVNTKYLNNEFTI